MSNHPHAQGALEEHDLGLSHDLPTILERNRSAGRIGRRGLLAVLGGVGAVAVAGCAADSATSATSATSVTDSAGSAAAGAPSGGPGGAPPDGAESAVEVSDGVIPEETAGPFPGDGSNGPDVLAESGIVRSDLTTSFGDASGVAEGVPTRVALTVLDLDGDAATPLVGAAVYLWHCDRAGRYSMYDDDIAEENYLRGVQESDADGKVTFTTIFPAAYTGRWPHMHFEVYQSLADATSHTNRLRTSQLAIPADACHDVYDTVAGYEASIANLEQTSLDSDMVFGDGHSLQLARAAGSATEGYALSLNIPV